MINKFKGVIFRRLIIKYIDKFHLRILFYSMKFVSKIGNSFRLGTVKYMIVIIINLTTWDLFLLDFSHKKLHFVTA